MVRLISKYALYNLQDHELSVSKYSNIFSLTSLLILSIASLLPISYSSAENPGVFSTDSAPYGVPYSDWMSRWWQWNMEIPKEQHPRDNYSPEKCSINQNGPVWFLPDILSGTEERTCTVPAGKAILVPMLTGEFHEDFPGQLTDSEIRESAMAGNEYGVISATLDGRPIVNVEDYRVQSFHNITVPEDNIFDNPPGTFRGMADGFFVFLEPLAPGNHELRITATVSNPVEPEYNFAAEQTYHLIIEPE